MNSFEYHLPTKIIFGKGAEEKVGAEISSRGVKRVLIVYGGGSVVKSGLLERVESSLRDAQIAYLPFGGVVPNPRVETAREGVQKAIAFGAELILAVGGGSVIDTAKGIAHGVANPEIDIWKFWAREATLTKTIPVGVILTISAAGSETSDSAVLQNSETHSKRGINTPLNRPAFAILNPELTYTLPKYQIACGATDIMMHTMERYFTQADGNDLTDAFAEALLKTVIKNGKAALENPCDYHAMSELMWCGSISHNGLTGLGGVGDWATHQLGMQLGAIYDIAHGASLSIMWPCWAKYVRGEKIDRFAKFARNVWGVENPDDDAAALEGIEKTAQYFASLGMPVKMSDAPEIGVKSDEEIRALTFGTTWEGKRTIGSFMKLGYEEIYEIFRAANV
ncbi:MAG: iron-containing alcohol dehydrogenase [Clostridia bacterium]|nr:iron-containing alcohol dehydrogenase [Clostridia bacterium]